MKIIASRPPNYEKILEKFPMASNQYVLFAYGDTLYIPSGKTPSESLMNHEEVHGKRQKEIGVEVWWDQYLSDPDFMYYEELLAHRAEYQTFVFGQYSRVERRYWLKQIAKRLSSQLYGKAVTFEQAKKDILDETTT